MVPRCSSQNWRICSFPSSTVPLCTSLNISCVVSEKLSLCSLSESCSLAITYSSCTFSLPSQLAVIVDRRGWVWLCGWVFKQSKVCVSNLCRRNVLTWFDWLSLGEQLLLSGHSAASVTSQFAWWLFAIPCKTHRFAGRAWQWLPCCHCPIWGPELLFFPYRGRPRT